MNREQSEKLLAAYLLEELDAETRAEMDAAIAADADLRDRLADMRMALKLVHQGLEEEVKPGLSEARRAALLSAAAQPHGKTTLSWWRRPIRLGVLRRKRLPHARRATPQWVRPLLGSAAAVAASLLLVAGIASLFLASPGQPQAVVLSANQETPSDRANASGGDYFYGVRVENGWVQSSSGELVVDGEELARNYDTPTRTRFGKYDESDGTGPGFHARQRTRPGEKKTQTEVQAPDKGTVLAGRLKLGLDGDGRGLDRGLHTDDSFEQTGGAWSAESPTSIAPVGGWALEPDDDPLKDPRIRNEMAESERKSREALREDQIPWYRELMYPRDWKEITKHRSAGRSVGGSASGGTGHKKPEPVTRQPPDATAKPAAAAPALATATPTGKGKLGWNDYADADNAPTREGPRGRAPGLPATRPPMKPAGKPVEIAHAPTGTTPAVKATVRADSPSAILPTRRSVESGKRLSGGPDELDRIREIADQQKELSDKGDKLSEGKKDPNATGLVDPKDLLAGESRDEKKQLVASDLGPGKTRGDGRDGKNEGGESGLPPASTFREAPVNPWVMTDRDRFSTFASDVDTASYTLCRSYLRAGYLPPRGAVRMEEFVNAFDYNYPRRARGVFNVFAEGAPSPFAPSGENTVLLKIGVQGRIIGREGRKSAHLVFVIDTSGSMAKPDRLPLIQDAIKMLADALDPNDQVTLIAYNRQASLVLECAAASRKKEINAACDGLRAGGPTNLLAGLEAGYKLAQREFLAGRINRVILCTDGAANIGQTDSQAILDRVAAYRRHGITLTVAGFGRGGYNDELLETLAKKGDGSYLFIDTQRQAREALVEKMNASLQTIAFDSRIQVDFNPESVRRYRLVGYEKRQIADEDFRNDAIDAAEVGSGQSATALYELELKESDSRRPGNVLGTVHVRYRNADNREIEEMSHRIESRIVRPMSVEENPRFALAACAGRFAEILRGSPHAKDGNLRQVERVLQHVCQSLPLDDKAGELLQLVRRAKDLPRAP